MEQQEQDDDSGTEVLPIRFVRGSGSQLGLVVHNMYNSRKKEGFRICRTGRHNR